MTQKEMLLEALIDRKKAIWAAVCFALVFAVASAFYELTEDLISRESILFAYDALC